MGMLTTVLFLGDLATFKLLFDTLPSPRKDQDSFKREVNNVVGLCSVNFFFNVLDIILSIWAV